jgi:hypothetical protein
MKLTTRIIYQLAALIFLSDKSNETDDCKEINEPFNNIVQLDESSWLQHEVLELELLMRPA